jgi:hypothetical protein
MLFTINITYLLYFIIFLIYFTFGRGEIQCTFIHGAGTIPEGNNTKTIQRNLKNLPEQVKKYWGITNPKDFWGEHMNKGACTSYSFTFLDTVNNAWDNQFLAKTVCDATKDKNGNPPMKQRIFLHSMGNLMFFNALSTLDNCGLKKKDAGVTVYSLGGPMKGSKQAQKAEEICRTQKNIKTVSKTQVGEVGFKLAKFALPSLISDVVDVVGSKPVQKGLKKTWGKLCDFKTGKLTPAFDSLVQLTDAEDHPILDISKEWTDGAICGTVPDNNILTEFVHKLNNGPKPILDDGAVHLSSCMSVNPTAAWAHDSSSNFWVAEHGHSDIIGRSHKAEILTWLKGRV